MADLGQTSPFDITKLTYVGAEYQRKLLEFSQENAKAALDFAMSLASCRSPNELVSLTHGYTRQQMEAVQRQTRELMELATQSASSTDASSAGNSGRPA